MFLTHTAALDEFLGRALSRLISACIMICGEMLGFMQALKMFRAVLSHFEEFKEDQFDFHSYCLRKLTLRAYIDLLHMEDELLSNPAYRDAATGAIQCYVHLFDDPPGRAERDAEERELAALPEAAQKKARDKKRREAEKKARLEAEKLERDRAAHAAKKTALKFDEVNLH